MTPPVRSQSSDPKGSKVIRADQHFSAMPIIALCSVVSPAAIERDRLTAALRKQRLK